jgi:rhamnulokinase
MGAESGRVVLGRALNGRLDITEIDRFPNVPVYLPDGLHWDVLFLFQKIKEGLAKAVKEYGPEVASAGLDTWGLDFALMDRSGALLFNPFHYRDRRTDGMVEEAFRRVPKSQIFGQTGIQFMQINALYQLLSMVLSRSPFLGIADKLLTIPDLFNYWLTGEAVCEFSNATTTQCYDTGKREWAYPLLQSIGIPTHIFSSVIQPGTVLGNLLPQVAGETGASGLLVVAPACHDTGSAVAAVPAQKEDFAYISSGTWSLMGAELSQPLINDISLKLNFTNEGGVQGTSRFLKNITGMWLVQECRRTWASQGENYSYDQLTEAASRSTPFQSLIDVDDPVFLKPGDMPARIRNACQKTGQKAPESKGEIIRCCLESIALKYRIVFGQMETALGRRLEPIHIIGGGGKNKLLNQFTANATQRSVITGPIEATAVGNILVQWMALKAIGSIEEGRSIVRNSFELETYEPAQTEDWDEAYERFQQFS